MKRIVMIVAATLVVGIAIGVITTRAPMAQQAPVTRTTLQQNDIEGAAGKEVIMYVADSIPGGVAGRHFHPGPEVAYVLEGVSCRGARREAALDAQEREQLPQPRQGGAQRKEREHDRARRGVGRPDRRERRPA